MGWGGVGWGGGGWAGLGWAWGGVGCGLVGGKGGGSGRGVEYVTIQNTSSNKRPHGQKPELSPVPPLPDPQPAH